MRSASTTTTSGSRRCCSRWTPSAAAGPLLDEEAEPGYYAATLSRASAARSPSAASAVHRYTFPEHRDARLVIDFSLGGLAIPHGGTVPLRAHLETLEPGSRRARSSSRARRWRSTWSATPGLAADALVRPPADGRRHPARLRPDPADHAAAVRPDVARADPRPVRWSSCGSGSRCAASTRRGRTCATSAAPALAGSTPAGPTPPPEWRKHLDPIRVDTPSSERRTVFATALYHSLIKPCFAPDESPFWPTDGPFVFDICTMWDIYRTQLPLITALFPERAVELANALLYVCEEEGNLPIGYRMARGADRFSRQGSALAHTFLADLCQLGSPGIDWDWALCTWTPTCAGRTARSSCCAAWCTRSPTPSTWPSATTARRRWRGTSATTSSATSSSRWPGGGSTRSTPTTGLLLDSTFYEGGRWNYSFRMLHDMRARIELAGGDERSWPCWTVLRLRRRPGQAGRRAARGRGAGRRLRAEPVRGAEQRAGHGGALGVPLRRPSGPNRRGRARRRAQPVRPRPRRAARQRRLGRAVLVVRLGLARAVPGRRARACS